MYIAIAVIGYGVGLVTNWFETRAIIDSDFDLKVIHETHLTYDLGRLGVTAGHLGLILLMCKAQGLRAIKSPLAAVGRMALTNYVMQTVICIVLFSGFGFGMYGRLERFELYYVVLAIWTFQLVLSPVWLRCFRFGPLEWAWRCLTYWSLQPLREKAAIDGLAS